MLHLFCRKKEKALVIKAGELRINNTAGQFRAPKLGTKHFALLVSKRTVVLFMTSFIFVLLIS